MPELPEVETTLRGIKEYVEKQQIIKVVIRKRTLRWPIDLEMESHLQNATVLQVTRRAKYLLFSTDKGTFIFHLGMTGRIGILNKPLPPKKHDHVDILFANKLILRFTDARRFGAFLWTAENVYNHYLIKSLGIEPLSVQFSGRYLKKISENKNIAIKRFIMDSKKVVGVGNIYAAEALFLANIHPLTPVKNLSLTQLTKLVKTIKVVLKNAIITGGTTLKDYLNHEGKKGYFYLHLKVYGRAGKPCVKCGHILTKLCIANRSTVYCKACQTLL